MDPSPSRQPERSFLSELPTEIKMRLVEFVALQTELRLYSYYHAFMKLALVDRTFYELCSPSNWRELDLQYIDFPDIDELVQEILPPQAKHVQSIIIAMHPDNPQVYEWDSDEIVEDEQIFPVGEYYEIFRICTNLTKLTIRLQTTSLSLDRRGDFELDPLNPITVLLRPISQLSNLTFIDLSHQYSQQFEETFLVELIKNMVNLVHIRLDMVKAAFPTCDFCVCEDSKQPFQSPLAIHLASLSSLKFLHFHMVDSFDSGWSKLRWKGALEGISLGNSDVSVRALHSFCKLFEDSLVYLCLFRAPSSLQERGRTRFLLDSERDCIFRLPRLKRLSVSNQYMTEFLKLFYESPNIIRICTMNYSRDLISFEDLKSFMNPEDPKWIHLRSLMVHIRQNTFSENDIKELIRYGAEAGVEVECGNLRGVRPPFFEGDLFPYEQGSPDWSDAESDWEVDSEDEDGR
ncbi:hypothetical protein PGTUg99_027285 [Puccinia graminis f. sp. tritici]|uniref:F-box domain-containing protein n=1 Tax=Puccinia graminis f. sp. tritici TaxID=56615 RepID=A0A5B0S593_PUCGR|nr:hypothetical protein PGTUg99_027285 [Puccinia graminis f. sp. tritici]